MGFNNKQVRNNKLAFLSILLLGLFIFSSINYPNNYAVKSVNEKETNQNEVFNQENLATSDLSSDNSLNGIGSPWNTTHWANRTDKNLAVQFENNSFDQVYVPLYSGWEGYKLEANISHLYDTRNWNNGSFHFGPDDDNDGINNNDTPDTSGNIYQNWTFQVDDRGGDTNIMSGNYFDDSYARSGGHDCLQLRMAGDSYSGRYWYNENDKAWWNSSFQIPRGRLVDNILEFEVNPVHVSEINAWEFRIYLNDVLVFSNGTKSIKNYGANQWHQFSIPQDLWINSSEVFTTQFLDDSEISIKVELIYSSERAGYGPEDGENRDYQELFFDNVKLITKAEAYPSDINLQLNGTSVNDVSWGKGAKELTGEWLTSKVFANFSSDDIWNLGTFEKNQKLVDYWLDLQVDLNLFARYNTGTVFETIESSKGTSFSLNNNSNVNWLAYSYVDEPDDYSEKLLKIDFPKDVNITFVGDPQDPSINILDQCENDTKGTLLIPIVNISDTPKGFWKLEGISPNYCKDIKIYNNITGSWELNSTFISGDFINITGKVNDSNIIKDYIDKTQAKLEIRLPNGSIWQEKTQYAFLKSNGEVNFEEFQIPEGPPNYQVGEYEAIITWNNSQGIYGMNETGLIYKRFSVTHKAQLIPEQYYYEDNFENSTVNLKVNFEDFQDSTPIENALVYTKGFEGLEQEFFNEISPGFYFLEFNVTGGDYGNNSLEIYANSSDYINQSISIKIEIINRTILEIKDDFLEDVQYNQNFTIEFNYTDKSTGVGISPETLKTNWQGDSFFNEISTGQFNLTCNTSLLDAGNLYTFYIYADNYSYQEQNASVSVYISELESSIKLYLNGKKTGANQIFSIGVRDNINVTIKYEDNIGNHLPNASVSISAERFTKNLTENKALEQYSIIIKGEELGQGIDNLIIIAQKTNYKPESIPFIAEISERATDIQILLNSINKTVDPFISVTTGSIVNLSINYLDDTQQFIQNANVSISGDIKAQLTEHSDLKQYSILINTSQLEVGIRKITLSAQKINYEFQTKDIRIEVKRIETEILTLSGDSSVNLRPGDNYTIQILLRNLETNQSILGANVNYTWIYGEESLTDINNDGIYEGDLRNIPEGTYTIVIDADLGEEYDVGILSITLKVSRPPEQFFAFQTTLIISAAIAIGLSSYSILYLKVLKYPKSIRKLRKFRKTLKREKDPGIDIIERKSAFLSAYQKILSKSPQKIELSEKKMEGFK